MMNGKRHQDLCLISDTFGTSERHFSGERRERGGLQSHIPTKVALAGNDNYVHRPPGVVCWFICSIAS